MVLARQSARWTSHIYKKSLRATRLHASKPRGLRIQRRTYASEGGEGPHATHKSGSDLPWAITSIAITVPATWYLLQPQLKKKSHGGGHGHESHSESEEHGESDADKADDPQPEPKEQEQEQEQEQGQDNGGQTNESGEPSDSSSEDQSDGEQDTPDSSDDESAKDEAHEKEGGANVEGVQFKGATNASGGKEQDDTRKHIPDAKGGAKKRIESAYGNKQGEATKDEQHPDNEDMEAASKPAGGENTQSGKQEGLSNTDTKHSTNVGTDPDKSSKADGTPETAKLKGTVDPSRPMS